VQEPQPAPASLREAAEPTAPIPAWSGAGGNAEYQSARSDVDPARRNIVDAQFGINKFDGDRVVNGRNVEATRFRNAALVAAGLAPARQGAPRPSVRAATRRELQEQPPVKQRNEPQREATERSSAPAPAELKMAKAEAPNVDPSASGRPQGTSALSTTNVSYDEKGVPSVSSGELGFYSAANLPADATGAKGAAEMTAASAGAKVTGEYKAADVASSQANMASSGNAGSSATQGGVGGPQAAPTIVSTLGNTMRLSGTADLTINGMPAGEIEMSLEGTGGA